MVHVACPMKVTMKDNEESPEKCKNFEIEALKRTFKEVRHSREERCGCRQKAAHGKVDNE